MPEWRLEFRPAAYHAFAKLDPAKKRRLAPAIQALRGNPRPPGVKRLSSAEPLWRIRVGAYRIVYTINDDCLVIVLLKLGHHRDVYRDL
jgi:mRNA interferase RelE/StbE